MSIATEWQKENEYPLPDGVKRLDVGLGEEESNLSRSARIRKRIMLLNDAIVEEKPDVLFAFLRNNNYRAVAAAKGTDTTVIVSEKSFLRHIITALLQDVFFRQSRHWISLETV